MTWKWTAFGSPFQNKYLPEYIRSSFIFPAWGFQWYLHMQKIYKHLKPDRTQQHTVCCLTSCCQHTQPVPQKCSAVHVHQRELCTTEKREVNHSNCQDWRSLLMVSFACCGQYSNTLPHHLFIQRMSESFRDSIKGWTFRYKLGLLLWITVSPGNLSNSFKFIFYALQIHRYPTSITARFCSVFAKWSMTSWSKMSWIM